MSRARAIQTPHRCASSVAGGLAHGEDTMTTLAVVGVIVMVIALLLTPVGVPGLWIMIAVLAVGWWFKEVSIAIVLGCVVLAGIAEVIEFLIVKRLNTKYGGSRLAFWGAIAGGIVGALI